MTRRFTRATHFVAIAFAAIGLGACGMTAVTNPTTTTTRAVTTRPTTTTTTTPRPVLCTPFDGVTGGGSMPGDAGNPHTCSQSRGHGPQLQAYCTVGTYSVEETNGPTMEAGKQVTIADDWPSEPSVEITGFAVVFYNDGTEVGSVAAGPQSGFRDSATDLNPYPVYLTADQSQTWTLAAGWSDKANFCVVVRITSSPPVSQD